MVAHKRLDYGFHGYQIPSFPRAPRSAKKKRLFKEESDKEIRPIELLAAVAGNLLQEEDSDQPCSNIADERVEPSDLKYCPTLAQQAEEKLLEPSYESAIVSDFSLQGHSQLKDLKECLHSEHDMVLEHCSIVTHSSCMEKSGHVEFVTGQRNEFVDPLRKTEVGVGVLCNNVVNGVEGQIGSETGKEIHNILCATLPNKCSSGCPIELDVKPPTLHSFDTSSEVPHTAFPPFQTNMKLVCTDNDEIFSGPLPNIIKKAFRPPPRIGDRRIRRLLASRYWKVPLKLNERAHSENDICRAFNNKKACYNRQKRRKLNLFRQKFFQHGLISRSEEKTYNEASPPSLVGAPEVSFSSRDSRVKFSIKSFRVPELSIEIPETATVSSLKRIVRDAVSAILSGGLCIGVVHQGKQVRDDSKTLLQSGISPEDELDALGFMLEPATAPYSSAPALVPKPLCREDSSFLVSCDIRQPLARYSPTLGEVSAPSDTSSNPTPSKVVNFVGDNVDAVLSSTDLSVVKSPMSAETLNVNPSSAEPLAAVPSLPPCRKPRQSELGQRRIRRPFFVSEVEALVEAVEKLGTGRWRDVKGFAFGDASHRTYVDLKVNPSYK